MIKTNKKETVKISKNIVIERDPVPVLGKDYKVRIEYKNINITELDLEKATIKISLPIKYKNNSYKQILDLAIEKMYEQIAKVEIERAMEKTRIMLGFAPEDFEIVNMKKLGECKESKISINPNVVMYSRDVIDYIVLHQYTHLKYKNHTKSFWEFIKKYQPDYKKSEEKLINI